MSTHPIAWMENDTRARAKMPAARIVQGARRMKRRYRAGWRRPGQSPGAVRGPTPHALSIEEIIARAIADNPPQLYRGGA